MTIKKAVIGIACVLFLAVLLQNTHVVTIHFLIWKISMSQIILISLMVLLGFTVGLILGKK